MKPLTALLLAILGGGSPAAEPASFDPEGCFPRDCLLYASADLGAWRRGAAEGLAGRLLARPEVRRAVEGAMTLLLADFRDTAEGFRRIAGRDLSAVAALLPGRASLTVTGIDRLTGPRLIVALELPRSPEAIVEVVDRLGAALLGATGGNSPRTETVRDRILTIWPLDFGPRIAHVSLGGHLVLAVGESAEDVISRHDQAGDKCLRSNERFARGLARTAGIAPGLTIFLDLERAREALRLDPPGADPGGLAASLGLDRVGATTLRAGLRDGALEGALFVESPGGAGGLLGAIAGGLAPPAEAPPPGRIPADAIEIAGLALGGGALVHAAEALRAVPALAGAADALAAEIPAEEIGVLPALTVHAFAVPPPSGGLVPDRLALARTAAAAPYLAILDRIAPRLGVSVTGVRAGDRWIAWVVPADAAPPHPLIALLVPRLPAALAEVDDEWTVAGNSPQAVARYLAFVRADEGGPSPTPPEGADGAWAILRGARNLPALWDTVLAAAMVFEPSLGPGLPVWLDLPALPAGSEVLDGLPAGFITVRGGPDGVLVRGRRFVSNLLGGSLLPAIAVEAWRPAAGAVGGGRSRRSPRNGRARRPGSRERIGQTSPEEDMP